MFQKKKTASKISYEERKIFNRLEKEIEKLENKKKELHNEMTENSTDFEKIANLNKELSELDNKIEEKTLYWMELGESM